MYRSRRNPRVLLIGSSVLSLVLLGGITLSMWEQPAYFKKEHTQLVEVDEHEIEHLHSHSLENLYEIDSMDADPDGTLARGLDLPPVDIGLEEQRRLDALRRRIEDRYDIAISIFDPRPIKELYGIDATPYPPQSLEQNLRKLSTWLSVYPPSYLKNSGLKDIYLFKGWEKNGTEASGFLLDRTSLGTLAHAPTLHHELFHVMDINDGGIRNDNYDWQRAKYGDAIPKQDSMNALQAIDQNLHEQERPFGYASAYGKYGGIEEDQATVVEFLLTKPKTLLRWSSVEAPLNGGVNYLKTFFYSRSNGQMDNQYWKDLEDGKVDPYYWENRAFFDSFSGTPYDEEQRTQYNNVKAARALLNEGSEDEAITIFKQAIDAEPGSTQYVHDLGRLLDKRRRYIEAIAIYEEALEEHNDTDLHLRLAANYKSLDQYTNAVEHYAIVFTEGYLTDIELEDFEYVYGQFIRELIRDGETSTAEKELRKMERYFGDQKELKKYL